MHRKVVLVIANKFKAIRVGAYTPSEINRWFAITLYVMFASIAIFHVFIILFINMPLPMFLVPNSIIFAVMCGFGIFAAYRYDIRLEMRVLYVCLFFSLLYTILKIVLIHFMYRIWVIENALFAIFAFLFAICFTYRLVYVSWQQYEVKQMLGDECHDD